MQEITKREYDELLKNGKGNQARRSKKHFFKIYDLYVKSNNGLPKSRPERDEY